MNNDNFAGEYLQKFCWHRGYSNRSFGRALRTFLIFLTVFCGSAAPLQASDCEHPAPVCSVRASVFTISSFDPLGSAVRIGPDTLVTSRHAVADETDVTVFLPDGGRLKGVVLPTDYRGDIVLIEVADLPPGPVMDVSQVPAVDAGVKVHTVGADVAMRAIRAYPSGKIVMTPAEGHPLARVHHSAYSQPGNSGGALVTETGVLVGIIASGGKGRNEAVPAAAIDELKARSGPAFSTASDKIGKAIRHCTLMLEDRRGTVSALTQAEADRLETACMGTGNRQYFDLAAEAFGASGLFGRSIEASEASLEQDPNSLNARMTAVVTYHLTGRFEQEIPHLRFLMQYIPDDPLVIRYGIQAGVWAGDTDIAATSFERLKASNPNLVPAAEKFIKSPPPRPSPRDLAR
ncbi:trypsin-like peptidase domain-containing protein [Hwanghaeella sp.]|uniref:trypsin-like peptidase domain-containing protein n=1 Tax=Hwanghaeella sp. TaxID=2605943 RepID=UPI003CCB8BC1